jgi:hypothetical protein
MPRSPRPKFARPSPLPELAQVSSDTTASPPAGERSRESAPDALSEFDYEQATTPRAQLARARGLAAPYIPGGRDPDPAATSARERIYVRLLIALVVLIVGGSILVSVAGLLLTGRLQ